METATPTRRSGPGPRPALPASTASRARLRRVAPAVGLALLLVGATVAFLVFPTYPNYDSYYSLVWGREVLHGSLPSFDAYRAPTEHPLAVLFGILLTPLGQGADRVMLAATLLSFVALVAGLYRLASVAFSPLVGVVAAALLCTRFDFPFLAIRGYIDVPYLAFVIWAAALEAARPRRGVPVLVLLGLAGLMRPEAWLLAGFYYLWVAWPAPWRRRFALAALTAAAPVIWVLTDYVATGQPLFSLTHTSGLAEELGRSRTPAELPGATVRFLAGLVKVQVFYVAALGVLAALYLAPRRSAVPFALLVAGAGTFLLLGVGGFSVIDRYLLAPSLMLMVFAGVAVAGWTMLTPSRLRTAWIGLAALAVLGAVALTATRVNLSSSAGDLVYRGDSHADLERVLAMPAVRAGLRCGPVSVPNHKLVPDTRWVLDAPEAGVLARADPTTAARVARGGVALLVTDRTALLRQAIVDDTDDPLDSVPPPGYVRVATTPYYGAYVKCPG